MKSTITYLKHIIESTFILSMPKKHFRVKFALNLDFDNRGLMNWVVAV